MSIDRFQTVKNARSGAVFVLLGGPWPNFSCPWSTKLALHLHCSIAALPTPIKVLSKWKLFELKMLDISDRFENRYFYLDIGRWFQSMALLNESMRPNFHWLEALFKENSLRMSGNIEWRHSFTSCLSSSWAVCLSIYVYVRTYVWVLELQAVLYNANVYKMSSSCDLYLPRSGRPHPKKYKPTCKH